MVLLQRHQSGDWGDLGEEDWRENDYAVSRALRIFSACGKLPDRLWVITAADRSVTTILRSDELLMACGEVLMGLPSL